MKESQKLEKALERFDAANQQDPNTELFHGKKYPKELLYARRMTARLKAFAPFASEALQLTARCQHICRWEIPRSGYQMNRTGYLKWRQELKKFHAKKASEILLEVGYSQEMLDKVTFLLEKKQLKKNAETQILEDVICLVFLEFYFEEFSQKYSKEKMIDVLQKTWKKMSEKGRVEALQLSLSQNATELIKKALA